MVESSQAELYPANLAGARGSELGSVVLTKILTVVLLGTLAVRLGVVRWKGLSLWFKRFVDVALIAIAVAYGVQLIIMFSR
ncbi:MAG: hypothetical protein AAGF11_32240 [Myxococcota bacterium]